MLTENHERISPEMMLSVKQVTSILSIHPSTVRRWERGGLLKAYRIGSRGNVRSTRSGVIDFVCNPGGAYEA